MQTNERTNLSDLEVEEKAELSQRRLHHCFHSEVTGTGIPRDTALEICYVGRLDRKIEDCLPIGQFVSVQRCGPV